VNITSFLLITLRVQLNIVFVTFRSPSDPIISVIFNAIVINTYSSILLNISFIVKFFLFNSQTSLIENRNGFPTL